MSTYTCPDYHCEGEEGHSHIGVQPHLRKVLSEKGELIDGKTGEKPQEEESDAVLRTDDQGK